MRLQLQQEDNHSRTNRNDDEDSHRRNNHRRPNTPKEANSNLLRETRREMDELRSAIREKTNRNLHRMVRRTDSPFTMRVLECPMPSTFRLPQIKSFDDLKDSLDHITTFKTTPGLQQLPNEILCRSFPTTLKGATQVWFSKLPTLSIDSFEQLGNSFVCHFVDGQHPKRSTNHLLTIKQGEKETLRSYVKRFTKEILEIDEADNKV